MTIAAPPPGLQPAAYDRIEAALAETAQGRAFLDQYARRIRQAESARILAAIARLDARLDGRPPVSAEAAALAERLMDLSWSLRESGVEDFVCAKIEALARAFRDGRAVPAPPRGEAPALPPVTAPEAAAEAEAADPRLDALSWLDNLPLVDRFEIFA